MTNIYCGERDYGIGTTPQGIVSLKLLHVPLPDQVVYQPAAAFYQRADFSRVGDGFASIQWIWDVISLSSLYKLLEFVGSETYANLYIQSDVRDGTYPNPASSFKVFSAVMWKPILTGQEGVSVVRTAKAYQTVKIAFMNVIEQAGYL